MLSVLISDTDLDFMEALRLALEERGHSLTMAGSTERCIELLHGRSFDIVMVDLDLPGIPGPEFIHDIRLVASQSIIIALARYNDIDLAIRAMKAGARDVNIKPVDIGQFLMEIEEMETDHLIISRLGTSQHEQYSFDRIASKNFQMQKILDEVKSFAGTDINILLAGESGTGKGLLAKTIHYCSHRGQKDFIEINCSAIPPTLLESELFGYERGAFTDARETRRGMLEMANNSTLFLDEISTMDYSMQSKLLKVIEDFRFFRVGGRKEITINTRIIAASNANLMSMVENREFRQDLFYRLNVAAITLPPLRERREDIVDIFLRFVSEFNRTINRNVDKISPDVAAALRNYNWPGNIRELRNVCERIMVIIQSDTIEMDMLPAEISSDDPTIVRGRGQLKSLKEIERDHILATLSAMNGNKSKTAKILGISRTTLISKVKEYSNM